ncbi:MAG: AAA family ATPase [Nitrosopumilaceae archaeon]|nr:AAA family ATPase [Nitrosopumilaceae archaeon]NIU00869.1 AAA family ATPase [Nitrosopumilaceae archaeon]NIU87322.1 AAA family ATPase [Nitrosopumilaceae archaeon]NIV65850.1 AAA family ATPase [Nitrosopumilaceae archaeon]NIX61471.1 AAA family ATPase [Nitrosopumilaceae archaeon]
MPGAGKSTIAAGLKTIGFEVINMGDEVRAEAKRRNIEPTGKNLGKLMLELREKNGQGAIAELITPKIKQSSSIAVVIDGIRSNAEIEVLRKLGNVKILAIHASTQTRFGFLKERGRSDDPKDRDTFTERDGRELKVGISNSIALADETISNNNLSKEGLIEQAHEIINNWIS